VLFRSPLSNVGSQNVRVQYHMPPSGVYQEPYQTVNGVDSQHLTNSGGGGRGGLRSWNDQGKGGGRGRGRGPHDGYNGKGYGGSSAGHDAYSSYVESTYEQPKVLMEYSNGAYYGSDYRQPTTYPKLSSSPTTYGYEYQSGQNNGAQGDYRQGRANANGGGGEARKNTGSAFKNQQDNEGIKSNGSSTNVRKEVHTAGSDVKAEM